MVIGSLPEYGKKDTDLQGWFRFANGKGERNCRFGLGGEAGGIERFGGVSGVSVASGACATDCGWEVVGPGVEVAASLKLPGRVSGLIGGSGVTGRFPVVWGAASSIALSSSLAKISTLA